MTPEVVRALEDLLRRVLHMPTGIDLRDVAVSAGEEVEIRRFRHRVWLAGVLSLGAVLLLAVRVATA